MRNPSSIWAAAAARPSTSKTPCCSKVGIKKGPWTPEEDEILAKYIKKEGEGRWRTLPKRAGLQRCGKSCRLRWMNYLRPCVKRGHIAPDEEDLILRLHRLLGNRWSLIAGRIPGRTDNEIKNYWNTHLSKKLISQGIDPRTHKPLENPSPPNTFDDDDNNNNNNPPSTSNQNPNPNPKSHELEETSSGYRAIANKGMEDLRVITNPNDQYYDNGMLMTNELVHDEDCYNSISMCNEDMNFSSFLDSLINESAFGNHHQQQLPIVSSAQTFDHGSFWEAQLRTSTVMDTLGDIQNEFNKRPGA